MSTWKPEDKAWLKARKEAWKPILQSLQESPETKRADIKPLREYFLTGQEPEILLLDDKFFFLFHRLWFHPDQSDENWLRLIEASGDDDFLMSRELFVKETHDVRIHVTEYGFMGGLEQRVTRVFFPETDPEAAFQFKGKTLPVLPWRNDYFLMMWGLCINEWLTYHASNPYCIAQYLLEHMWNSLHLFDREHLKKSGDYWLRGILTQCAHFVEPQGLQGDDTPQRRFVEKFKRQLNERDLPDFIKDIWNNVQERKNRSGWTSERIDEISALQNDFAGFGYVTLAIHKNESKPELIEQMVQNFIKLGFSDTEFESASIDQINLGSHLSPEVISRLGYEKGDPIPGYRFQIETTADFMDSDDAKMLVDFILPLPHQKLELQEDTPVFFVVLRPDEPYNVNDALAYNLNLNLVRRTFKSDYGFDLLRYESLDMYGKSLPLFEKKNPYYRVKYQPMVNFRKPILNTPEEDFPEWQGRPLPPLFA